MTIDPPPAHSDIADPARRGTTIAGAWPFVAALAGALIIDQVTKELALHALLAGPESVAGIQLRLVANRGILLGFPAPPIVIVIATIVVVVAAMWSARNSHWMTTLAFGLLAGGALGNLADRFQDRHFFPSSAVVDWISAGRITFNLADVFLLAGAAILVLLPRSSPATRTRRPA